MNLFFVTVPFLVEEQVADLRAPLVSLLQEAWREPVLVRALLLGLT